MNSAKTSELARLASVVGQLVAPPEDPPAEGTTMERIVEVEHWLGYPLPESLRDWLLIMNGPCVGPGGLVGIQNKRPGRDLKGILESYPKWKECGLLPVAGDGCGDYYVLIAAKVPQEGAVAFVDVMADMDKPTYLVASDLLHFLDFYFGKELGERRWPFNSKFVLSKDPALQEMAGEIPPAWE